MFPYLEAGGNPGEMSEKHWHLSCFKIPEAII